MHTSDPHVDTIHHGKANPQSGLDHVFESNLQTLDYLVDQAIDENVDMFLLAGDLVTAGSPKPEVYIQLSRILNKLIEHKIPLQMVEGNHERLWLPAKHHSSMNVISHMLYNVHAHDDCTQMQLVKHENCNVLVVPYPVKARILSHLGKQRVDPTKGDALVVKHVLDQASKMLEERDSDLPLIITGHFTVDGIGLPGSEADITNLMHEAVFPVKGFEALEPDYVALGHIHTPQQVGDKSFYSGSPNKLTFTDANDVKGGNLVSLANGNIDMQRVETPVRGMYKVNLEEEEFSLSLKENDVVQVLLPEGETVIPTDIQKLAKDAGASLFPKVKSVRKQQVKRSILPEKISPITALNVYLKENGEEAKTIEDLVNVAKNLGVSK